MPSQPYRISISIRPQYLPEQSDPEEQRYVFAYQVNIRNEGSVGVKLLSRHWVITDAVGNVEEVRGEGVVGEQPELAPGEEFEYSSGCPLPTAFGSMRGSYQFVADDGTGFEAEIPEFFLVGPRTLH
ncbi:MAG: Co2+/Mg2+ efflux protein ApaG [Candidatus Dactylopiibacterium carminicum]|uniref:Protein ApaG n=1 Tax=Candidatus Dactylopiibacterium carminicum TaxID=857335 RepID=A0A272ERF4_9RHOO|nr:Co2+/Mg2+ efflux protein ApaG [Candidatus Dactylopiibacterium carminicum]KAF7598715.1 Co2+/Mg2+ efflux protein ApaG [Candidatus Dactylopiibacterium carminicum]PAS92626.1 MAG: Co2+/Mg2+ efflux protein ApaG [Candidatus Dactylopiibacterium carminicum]PAS96116.1 MAG: Co2+/Mg2+ efflux protein ApaG [Candidatus Dactylopiibacterium carminicum]PAS98734.1 MAG: Co2+/Mg2+ efflux protein ApaG [Candidatus Dactylopiibacterium carminicum]